jgi:trk system potassium uptake protein
MQSGGISMFSRNESNTVIIAGSSRFGLFLADQLSKIHEEVTIIDSSRKLLDGLAADFSGSIVEGDAGDIEILRQAGINQARALIAATDHDNENLMIAQIAREIYDVPTVIAVVVDPDLQKYICNSDFTVLCPAWVMTQAALQELSKKEGAL